MYLSRLPTTHSAQTPPHSLRLRHRCAPNVPRLPARIGLVILPRPPLRQLVVGSVQRLHGRDAQAKAHAERDGRERVLLGLWRVRAAEEQDYNFGSCCARQEGRNEGAQVPRVDCDRRFSSGICFVANTLGQYLEPGLAQGILI